MMYQEAPHPTELEDLIQRLHYKDGWGFELRDLLRDPPTTHSGRSWGLTLSITIVCRNSYSDEMVRVSHLFPVPPATYDQRSWQRWLFEQIVNVERHEAMEFFRLRERAVGEDNAEIVTEYRPYAPSHGPGNDPYMLREVGTDIDARTSFRGALNPA